MLKRNTKIIGLLLAFTVGSTIFAGCSKKEEGGVNKKTDQVIVYNLGADPKTLDPALNAAVDGATVLSNAFEGLTKLDNKDAPIAGVAERWDISSDELEYTFHLRKDAKWSDGQQVKASDFEYAWKRALDPNTAAEYAYQLYYLKNAESYNSKEAKDGKAKATVDEIGVKAIDDSTLKVTLEYPTKYFLSLTAFPTYFPVRKDIVDKNPTAWSNEVSSYISNGPFKMSEWKPKDTITFVKNENYWNESKIKLEKIEYKMIDEATAALSAFKTGQFDIIESPPAQELPNLLKDGTAKIYPSLGTYFYCLNLSDKAEGVDKEAAKALKDPKVRKALTLAINRKDIVENVTKGEQIPAVSFVPKGIKESGDKDFQNKEYYKPEGNIEEAKKLLAEAGYPEGKGFPTIPLSYNTNQGHQNIAQAVQDMWRKNLGIEVELKNEEWKVFQESRNNKDYIIARHGWIGDYSDPMTFLDMWSSTSGNNDAAYDNKDYDKALNNAKNELDPAKRMAFLHEAEDLLMNDMPIVPIYYYTNIICQKDYVKGVVKSPLGFVFFENAYVEK
ncbi:oligopeptide ABC transporter periplasmic oligopeptide-binding protein [Clostridium putrefaciens]|uniref:Oligopeptide ABC transporter periplasmic oligopeptide-binding protein n=1 Tax=Clostridium putrefaciens TaxID=99675 RepID=A0A381J7K1_9CLOT|nr:peptide ABC transporter substrate-binding protein [Clostridium putrefaciens]SUY46959.1 oligopeptide ABC transporter periplasmic oligopeptide-binding protein [Clostridium putrefaciens]